MVKRLRCSTKKLLKEIKAKEDENFEEQLARKLRREDPERIKKLGKLRYVLYAIYETSMRLYEY